MFKPLAFFAILAVACNAEVILDVNQCPGSAPLPQRVRVNCDSWPCGLSAGESVEVSFDVNVTTEVTQMPTVVTIYPSGGGEITFPLPTGDACSAVQAPSACPLSEGTHTIVFPVVLNGLPVGTSTARVAIADQAGRAVACGMIDVTFSG